MISLCGAGSFSVRYGIFIHGLWCYLRSLNLMVLKPNNQIGLDSLAWVSAISECKRLDNKTYDEFLALVAEFRLEHRNLMEDELDKLIKKTFRIDQGTLRELNGITDLIQSSGKGLVTKVI